MRRWLGCFLRKSIKLLSNSSNVKKDLWRNHEVFFFVQIIFCLAHLSFAATAEPSSSTPAKDQNYKKLVIIGDSLTEGYGVAAKDAFPALLEQKVLSSGYKWKVINSGVSGSTTASALGRSRWQLKLKPDIVILELGANDGLRGLSTEDMYKNLDASIKLFKQNKVTVILAGMQMPPNYSKDYTRKFENVFKDLAKKNKIKLIPFLLESVAGEVSLNQADGIHPNEKGHKIIAENIFKEIRELL